MTWKSHTINTTQYEGKFMNQITKNESTHQTEKTVVMKLKITKIYSMEELSETNTANNNETVFITLNS